MIFAALGATATGLLFWLGWMWLARPWQVLDDDELSQKLSGPERHSPAVWMRMLGWFKRGPKRLTYRRDERGRFRRIRR